jgi:hypothetical protein
MMSTVFQKGVCVLKQDDPVWNAIRDLRASRVIHFQHLQLGDPQGQAPGVLLAVRQQGNLVSLQLGLNSRISPARMSVAERTGAYELSSYRLSVSVDCAGMPVGAVQWACLIADGHVLAARSAGRKLYWKILDAEHLAEGPDPRPTSVPQGEIDSKSLTFTPQIVLLAGRLFFLIDDWQLHYADAQQGDMGFAVIGQPSPLSCVDFINPRLEVFDEK